MALNELVVKLVVRNDIDTNWNNINPVLLNGEIGYESNTGKLKIGDGTKSWKELDYFLGDIETLLNGYLDKTTYKGSADGVVKAADKLATPRAINGVNFDGTGSITIEDNTKIAKTQLGVAGGVATLDGQGKVPSAQLPSYVDDVVEGYYYNDKFYQEASHVTVITGEAGKIYVDLASDKGGVYRFSGTGYLEISNPLDIASEAEAIAGVDNTKAMTALRTAQAINAKGYITETDADNTYEPKFNKNTAFNKNFSTTAGGALTSGGTGVAGSSSDVARADHTHTLPAYPTSLPPTGNAGGDLTGTYPNPTIKNNAVTTAKIADKAVTDAKLDTVNVAKLFVADGDTLVINGGNA